MWFKPNMYEHKDKHYQTLANTRSPGLNATLFALILVTSGTKKHYVGLQQILAKRVYRNLA